MRLTEMSLTDQGSPFATQVLQSLARIDQRRFLVLTEIEVAEVAPLRQLIQAFDTVAVWHDPAMVQLMLPQSALGLFQRQLRQLFGDGPVIADVAAVRQAHQVLWRAGRFTYDVSARPLIYGILNVTPDSFYDGGRFTTPAAIRAQVATMVAAGVDVIEVGGQTTRPGFTAITEAEEIQRIEATMSMIRQQFPQVGLAVDTYKVGVMKRALALGVDIINDVNAFTDVPEKRSLLAASSVGLLTMHSSRTHEYINLTQEMRRFFTTNLQALTQAGIARDRIALDPGIGYAKVADGYQDYAMMRNINQFNDFQRPLMVAISRKGFGKRLFNLDKEDRLPVSLVVETYMTLHGGNVLRVHDVAETKQLVQMLATLDTGYWFRPTADETASE